MIYRGIKWRFIMERNVYLELTPPVKAREIWFQRIKQAGITLSTEKVTLDNASGRTVAEPIAAVRSSPAFHGAAMDGIAVAAEKTFTASQRNPVRLEIGKDAFWINTGRPLPTGTNAVVMVEQINTDNDDRYAILEKAAFPWQHVRKMGEDMVATEIILTPGTVIGAYELGALAACGVGEIPVFKKPKVILIPSGSEIATPEQISKSELESGEKLPEFNSCIFSAMIAGIGGQAAVMPIVPDEPDKIKAALKEAAAARPDLIILNAGASAGSHDYSAHAIKEIGELLIHGIAMMPGKPTSLGLIDNVPILGAPGYPVSAIMALEEFALPLLAYLQRRSSPARPELEVLPYAPLPSRPGMEERIRVKLGCVDGVYYAVPLSRGAGTVSSLSRADAIINVPAASEGIGRGEPVKASLLRPKADIGGSLLAIGSHDNTLDLIDSFLRRDYPGFRLTSAHVGSLGGLVALKAGQCHIAGSHLLDPETGIYNKSAILQQLPDVPVALIRLVDREQGLMLMPGNPLQIRDFEDLTRGDVTFINRQRGSGTRVLLDYELAKRGIPVEAIKGYGEEEYTHMNVASAVLSGRAHTGLGSRAAANALGLDFLPVGIEQYDLVIPVRYLEDERIKALREVIRSQAFKQAVSELGGYGLARTGDLIWRSDLD